jgi:replicative DNA helicase
VTFSASEVRSFYASRLPSLKITNQREWRGPCPIHNGKDPNFAVNAETGLAQCHSQCGRGWDLISLEQELSGLDFPKAKDRVFELVGRPKVPWEERNVEAIYDYTDESGRLLYQVLRYFGKEFKQRRPDGRGGWVWGLGDTQRVPYRLPRLSSSEFVGIVEGEKDVLTLERLDMVATCNNGGAGNFKPELVKFFSGKKVGIFPDNDDPGRDHALKVATLLGPVAKTIKIVELPDIPLKGDVTDFVNRGGTVAELRELYRKAQEWTPDFEFASNLPNENDQWVRTFEQEVEAAGGPSEFWDLSKLAGLETPWAKLSRALGGGMRRGEVYVIGANQGAGKTSLALQFAMAAMRRREAVLYFSMEMGHRAVFQRMAAIAAGVDLNVFRDAQFTIRRRESGPEERAAAQKTVTELSTMLSRATADLIRLPLLVSTKSSVTPEYIIEETTRLSKREKIKIVIVDHMQLMGTTGTTRGDYEKFTLISRAMKQVAVDINVPLLLISQTSRNQSKEHRGELEVSDLRGSGAIEEDAAGVLLLYEDKADRDAAMSEGHGERYTRGPVKAILKLGKNRYGEQGRCFELRHFKATTHFETPEESEVPVMTGEDWARRAAGDRDPDYRSGERE